MFFRKYQGFSIFSPSFPPRPYHLFLPKSFFVVNHKTPPGVAGRLCGYHKTLPRVAGRLCGHHKPLPRVAGRLCGHHKPLPRVAGRLCGHHKTSPRVAGRLCGQPQTVAKGRGKTLWSTTNRCQGSREDFVRLSKHSEKIT